MNHFAYPEFFWLLLLPFLIRALLPAAKGLHGDALRVPFVGDITKISLKSGGLWGISADSEHKISLKLILLYIIWALLVTAAARPQWVGEPVRIKNYSRDILMVTDISNSMLEADFSLRGRRIDRMTAVKLVASDFIKKRTDDRIGLILFGTRAYLQAPVTYDKKSVEEILKNADPGMAGDSTAIGDALGYPVEFIYSYAEIQARYGERGITRLDVSQWWTNEDGSRGKAWISDDTQMTLFTACGILNAKAQGSAPLPAICEAYLEWLYTQMGRHPRFRQCWIGEIPELNQRRAPGNTCEDALRSILRGKDPHNHSKGCGGVMRIAPIPLYGMAQGRIPEIEDLDMLAAEAAKLTHQHPLGYIPAALMAHVIYRLATDEAPTRDAFSYYIKE